MVKALLSTVIAFFSLAGTYGQTRIIDKVVAQVGDNIILLSDLEGQKTQAIQSGYTLPENVDCIYLEELMYQNLLVNQAELDSVVISDEQVDAEMENRIRSIEAQMRGMKDEKGEPITFEKFYGKSKTQVKEEFRTVIRKRLQGQEVERTITQDITVSPKEVEAFFNKVPSDSLPFINTKLTFQQIAIFPVITKLDKQRAYNQLEEIRKDIVERGKNFETQARIWSEDPGSKSQGGRMEATRGMMVKPFEATAYNLKPGEVSNVFETEFGYHVMKLIDRKGDDYVVNHILIAPKFSRDSLESASKRIDECYRALKENRITWDEAVKKYSNDPNTKENRGIITNPITGEQSWDIEEVNQVDPQMFQLTDVLEKGQVTAPTFYNDYMERKEALRIVRLAERTEPHKANLKDDYVMLRTAAENEKRQLAIQKWTASRISSAYIRIDDEYKGCTFRNVWVP